MIDEDAPQSANLTIKIVKHLANEGCSDLTNMASQFGVNPEELFPLKDQLVADGMIRQVSDPTDPRKYEEPFVPYELNL